MVKVLSIVGVLSLIFVVTATVFIAGQPTSPAPKASDENRISTPGFVADSAFVDSEMPDKNFGSSPTLWADGQPKRISYVKLNLSSLAGKSVNRAVLRMFVTHATEGVEQIRFVSVSSWTGDTITYNVRPLSGELIKEISGGSEGQWLEVDLTGFVNQFKGQVVSVAIESSDSNGLAFNSVKSPFDRLELEVE